MPKCPHCEKEIESLIRDTEADEHFRLCINRNGDLEEKSVFYDHNNLIKQMIHSFILKKKQIYHQRCLAPILLSLFPSAEGKVYSHLPAKPT